MIKSFGEFVTENTLRLSPMTTHIVTHDSTGSSATIIHRGPRTAHVTGVNTPPQHRGRGGADAVLRKVTAHLDQHGLHADLYAQPTNGETNVRGLKRLYARHGFRATGEGGHHMVREYKP